MSLKNTDLYNTSFNYYYLFHSHGLQSLFLTKVKQIWKLWSNNSWIRIHQHPFTYARRSSDEFRNRQETSKTQTCDTQLQANWYMANNMTLKIWYLCSYSFVICNKYKLHNIAWNQCVTVPPYISNIYILLLMEVSLSCCPFFWVALTKVSTFLLQYANFLLNQNVCTPGTFIHVTYVMWLSNSRQKSKTHI